ncbi:MAG: hypothetical protein MRZ93_03090 [Lachnospiraceae bacterium]|nr:hypothetical protein [Lachnospiraceae bacterium]
MRDFRPFARCLLPADSFSTERTALTAKQIPKQMKKASQHRGSLTGNHPNK